MKYTMMAFVAMIPVATINLARCQHAEAECAERLEFLRGKTL